MVTRYIARSSYTCIPRTPLIEYRPVKRKSHTKTCVYVRLGVDQQVWVQVWSKSWSCNWANCISWFNAGICWYSHHVRRFPRRSETVNQMARSRNIKDETINRRPEYQAWSPRLDMVHIWAHSSDSASRRGWSWCWFDRKGPTISIAGYERKTGQQTNAAGNVQRGLAWSRKSHQR